MVNNYNYTRSANTINETDTIELELLFRRVSIIIKIKRPLYRLRIGKLMKRLLILYLCVSSVLNLV